MTDPSLRRRLALTMQSGDRAVRAYAPGRGSLAVRSLLDSLRVIHLSDLHFSGSSHTLDWRNDQLVIDAQDSAAKSRVIGDFLCAPDRGPEFFGTPIVVVTGDLTDSGDDEDYPVAQAFVERLARRGFDVQVVPGNHDYCKEGNLVVAEVLARVTPPLPPSIDLSDLASLPGAGAIREATAAAIRALVPDADLGALLDYLVDQVLAWPPVTDTADNRTRRQRFIDRITHDGHYPRIRQCGNGWLILLDSMQGQLDGPGDFLAQGRLGAAQLALLDANLEMLRAERHAGRPVVVCLHHSPLSRDGIETSNNRLADREAFLHIVDGRIDALLFGHVGPSQESHDAVRASDARPCMPLGNSENLEPMSDTYPVTVADLGARLRVVFQAGGDPARPPRLDALAAAA